MTLERNSLLRYWQQASQMVPAVINLAMPELNFRFRRWMRHQQRICVALLQVLQLSLQVQVLGAPGQPLIHRLKHFFFAAFGAMSYHVCKS